MAIHVRTANAHDVPTIRTFIQELAAYERLQSEVVATAASLSQTLFGERPAAEVLIAECEGRPAGFALFFPNYSTFLAAPGLYLEDLFVKPELRGKGIGLALMVALAKIAVERGYQRFEWSVLDWNEPALRFYRSLGATPQSEWTVQRLTGDALQALARRNV